MLTTSSVSRSPLLTGDGEVSTTVLQSAYSARQSPCLDCSLQKTWGSSQDASNATRAATSRNTASTTEPPLSSTVVDAERSISNRWRSLRRQSGSASTPANANKSPTMTRVAPPVSVPADIALPPTHHVAIPARTNTAPNRLPAIARNEVSLSEKPAPY